ncbi:disintegrin and metalloproteinase domain-containing protein 2 isoform X2 [Tupaia chinensis]|nr:disintegrin and metalloproteinase domain-containing protein 2 isoform X2 [Tupaia chinensis]XP_006164798.1 disintegrin and metalloproteinase domain-containing protein 2 isoform X2 [Tupaia chinensis]
MQPFEEQFQELCYYQGYIEGYPNSMVIVSTCTGLRGILQFENISYGIEPLEASIGFEHVIYQVKDKNAQFSLYTEKDVESRDLPYKIQSVQPSEFSQYIEMHVVVEKYLYNRMGSDTAIVTQKIFQLIGLTNSIFTSFNVTIILSSLELWIDENKIVTTGDANDLLHRFLSWKRSYLALRPHDVAFLLVYREKSNYVGATFQGKMCDKNYGGGVALHPRTISLESLSVIIAQLLSLSMGIAYDDVNKCQCPGRVCVMNPEAIHSSGVKSFSNCSMEDFVYFISKQKSHCLQNQPHLVPSYKAAVCGNGIVEEGEKCDCGSEEECAVTQPACCTAATCQLSAGSTCATGLCCENCQFQAKGRECRSSSNECDLPEYCNGSSELCQEDFFVQNGHSCGQNQWICLEGQCISGINQCSDLFGGEADFGNEECFNYLNSMADQSGSCGSDASGYKKCNPSDVNCGKLICIYTSEELIKIPDATTIYANISGHICVSIDYPYDHQENAKMWVKEGTVCGSNKVCKDHACVSSSYLGFDCTPQKCHQQGVCNNKKNCHCDAPYLPPDCQTMKNNWPGGSIDSGNYQSQLAQAPDSRGSYVEQRVYYPKPTRWPFFLFIPFFLVLCVLIAFLVKLRFQRKNERNKDYSSNEQLESECESKE